MNLERVKDRVEKGGRLVEKEKVKKRYFLTMDLLIDVLKKADETYLWDNSGIKYQFLGSIRKGILNLEFLNIQAWVDTYILRKTA